MFEVRCQSEETKLDEAETHWMGSVRHSAGCIPLLRPLPRRTSLTHTALDVSLCSPARPLAWPGLHADHGGRQSWRTMDITWPPCAVKTLTSHPCLECERQAASQHPQHTHLAQVTWPRKRQSTSVSTHAAPLKSEDGPLDRYTLAGRSRSCSS